MKHIFFLIPLLAIGIIPASAYVGYDYSDVTNPDGTHGWSTHPPYMFDGSNYVPSIHHSNTTETEHGNVVLNSDGSYSFYPKGDTTSPLFTDKIIAKYSDVSNLNSWTYVNSVNNAVPQNIWDGTQFVSSKLSGVGKLDYKYVDIGLKWKTQLEATNLSALNTKAFGFDQIVDLNRDTISFGGVTRNLDSFNGTTFNKVFLDANKGKILNFLNGVNFDFDLGYDNLYSVTVYDTGINKSRLVFDYRTNTALLPGQTLVIDPTFGYDATGTAYQIDSADSASALCNVSPYVESGGFMQPEVGNSGLAQHCSVGIQRWDTSSLPASIIITNATIRYDISGAVGGGTPCNWYSIEFDPTTASAETEFFDARNGTQFVSTSTQCMTIANDKILQLPASAFTDIQNNAPTNNWWAIGVSPEPFSRNATRYADVFTNSASTELQIEYVDVGLGSVSDLSNSTNPTINTIGLNWTSPSITSPNTIIGYQINVTTPQTNSPLVFLNDTGNNTASVSLAILLFGTDYSARISAWANVTNGHPLLNVTGNVFNFTTASGISYATLAPSLIVIDNHTNTSVLNLDWTAPDMDNINGYRIYREAPVGSGFSQIVANTSSTQLWYNNTGLVVNTYYNYYVQALNGTGLSTISNTYSATTHHLPDAVTSLSVSMTDSLSAILTWIQPTLYGYVTGYQINYTTPAGDPLTIYTNTTGSSSLTATVGGLESGDIYSFRVSAVTFHGKNATGGAITNGTAMSNFDIGSVYLPTGTNADTVPIAFDVDPINSTTSHLTVTYDSSYTLACDFSRPISQTNQTYSGLTENPISGTSVYSNFTVNGIGNDLVDVYCWDESDNSTNGNKRLGMTSIPLIGQINGYQTGAFGTGSGKFGALDMMTLIVVIVSMIGFNRTHPIVGVAFMAVFLGAMTFYGAITVATTALVTGMLVLVFLLALIHGRRDDAE